MDWFSISTITNLQIYIYFHTNIYGSTVSPYDMIKDSMTERRGLSRKVRYESPSTFRGLMETENGPTEGKSKMVIPRDLLWPSQLSRFLWTRRMDTRTTRKTTMELRSEPVKGLSRSSEGWTPVSKSPQTPPVKEESPTSRVWQRGDLDI